MSNSISRPDDATIAKYVAGELSEVESEVIERYLESEPDLPSLAIPAGDTLLTSLRGQHETPVDPIRIQKVLDWLERMGMGPSPNPTAAQADSRSSEESDAAAEVIALLRPPLEPGEMGTLGGYRVVRVLGRGGMGVVLEAIDPGLNRRIALKAMRPALANNLIAKQRFVREAELAASVEHDHIVPIFQIGEDRGVLFLAMPLLRGEPLDAKIKRDGRLTPIEVARYGRQAAEGLTAAHEAGLIHRDIKPANLWLESPGIPSAPGTTPRIKVLDFGLARTANSGDVNLTTSGVIMGTPAYMAPEQASGKPLDGRADLFSLGVVLYRAATGEMPFKGDSPIAIIHSLALDTPAHPCVLHPELPRKLGDLIERLLAKEAGKRPASAREVAKTLGAIEHELTNDTVPIAINVKPIVQALSPWQDIDDSSSIIQPTPAASSEKTPPKPRKKMWIGASLLGLAVAIAAVVIVIIKDKDGKEVARVNVPEGGSVEIKPKQAKGPKVPDGVIDEQRGRQTGPIRRVAHHPNGKVLVSSGDDGLIHLWDAQTLRQLTQFKGAMPAFADDGKMFAIVGADVCRWDFAKNDPGRAIVVMETPPGAREVAVTRDGKVMAIGCNNPVSVSLWDLTVNPPRRRGEIKWAGEVLDSLTFDTQGRFLITGSHDKTVRLWDVRADEPKALGVIKGHGDWVYQVAISPDGKWIGSAGAQDWTARLWTVENDSGTEAGVLKFATATCSVAFSPDSKTFAVGLWTGDVHLYELKPEGPKLTAVLKGLKDHIWSLSFSKDGKTIAAGGMEGIIRLWEVETSKESQPSGPDRKIAEIPSPRPTASPPDKETPFVVIRDGKAVGAFKSFTELQPKLAAGDDIVVHGNGPFELPLIRLEEVGLSIKAAPGYRPRFRPPAGIEHGKWWIVVVKAPLRLEGCDFISDHASMSIIQAHRECDIIGCRIAKNDGHSDTILQFYGSRARVVDSMIFSGFTHVAIELGPKIQFEFENNTFWNKAFTFFTLPTPGGQNIKLVNNTFFGVGYIIEVREECRDVVDVEATRNVFASAQARGVLVGDGLRTSADFKKVFRWKGLDNLVVDTDYLLLDERKTHLTKLDEWQKYWGNADRGMLEAKGRMFQFDAAWADGAADERIRVVRQAVEAARPPSWKDAGPDWDQIGPGEGLLNCFAAAGHPIKKEQLRPKAPEGGPVVLVRNGKVMNGHADIAAACEAAVDDDIIQLHSDAEFPDLDRMGAKPKRLTLRAAPGYRPIMNSLGLHLDDDWVIEGIHFKGIINSHVNGSNARCGQLTRLANCSFEPSTAFMCINGRGKAQKLEIVNCLIPQPIWVNAATATQLIVRNSVLGGDIHYLQTCLGDQRLEFDRCVFWNPARQHWVVGCAMKESVLTVEAKGCWFETSKLWANAPTGRIKWSGDRNVFRLPAEIWFWEAGKEGVVTRLDQWQKQWGSDANSIAIDSLVFDPRAWQLLKGSAGQGKGPGGADLGADVGKVAYTATQQLSIERDRKIAEWVLKAGGKVIVFSDVGEAVELNGADAKLPAAIKTFHSIDLRGAAEMDDAALENLRGISGIQYYLFLGGHPITDAGLKQIASIPSLANLTNLDIERTKVTDAGMAQLKRFQNLVNLGLTGTSVSAKGLRDLRDLPELTGINVGGPAMNDAALKELRECPHLGFINLFRADITDAGLSGSWRRQVKSLLLVQCTSVTDAGLEHLADSNLSQLNVKQTKVTAEGVKKLAAALPACKIEWDGGTIEPRPNPDSTAK